MKDIKGRDLRISKDQKSFEDMDILWIYRNRFWKRGQGAPRNMSVITRYRPDEVRRGS
jgi:hypothetical protein